MNVSVERRRRTLVSRLDECSRVQYSSGVHGSLTPMDRLDAARALLAVARLMWRVRRAAAIYGTDGAEVDARRVAGIGREIGEAIAALETASSDGESAKAVARLDRASLALWTEAQRCSRTEGICSLIGQARVGIEQRVQTTGQ
jgi:hypothetical protein